MWDKSSSSSHQQKEEGQHEPEVKPVSSGPLFFDQRWVDDIPSLMSSDTEDDSSLPEYPPPRKTSIHEVETKPTTDLNRHVRFGEAHIREHPMISGGCCGDALPLSLDWGFQDERVYDIDDYETMRVQSGRKERGKVARIDQKMRKRILASSSAEVSRTNEAETQDHGGDRFSPVDFGDQNGEVEYESSFPNNSPGCNPFEAMQESAWGMFGYNGIYPSMTVQILED
jgi:hypothetical protein